VSPGPASFYYDRAKRQLVSRGAITDERKRELVALVTKKGTALTPPDAAGRSYWQALDALAFSSNESAGRIALLVIILGGLSGLVGVQLRSVINFVEVTTRKNSLDTVRWWPWYVGRPAAGFIFGAIAVLLLRIGLLDNGEAPADDLSWALAIGILAGFGATEFAERLRLLVKTLFGEGPREDGAAKRGAEQPDREHTTETDGKPTEDQPSPEGQR
jgi:hypothetical protein